MLNETLTTETSSAKREQLIMEHLPQVRLIARRIHDRLPGNVNLDDLVSTGIVGLISAIDRYDETQGVKLRTYAEYKIRGAILDSLRGLDWAPRRQRRRAKQIEKALAAVEQRTQKQASEGEIAAELGIAVEEYRDWLAEVRSLPLGSLDVAGHDEDGREMLRHVADRDDMWPSRLMERAQLQETLAQAVERMPHAERTVLSLYYTEELTLREIARVLDLHESRISQLKTQALIRLRAFLERKWPDKGAAKPTAVGRQA